jgi:hypothetical protein
MTLNSFFISKICHVRACTLRHSAQAQLIHIAGESDQSFAHQTRCRPISPPAGPMDRKTHL